MPNAIGLDAKTLGEGLAQIIRERVAKEIAPLRETIEKQAVTIDSLTRQVSRQAERIERHSTHLHSLEGKWKQMRDEVPTR